MRDYCGELATDALEGIYKINKADWVTPSRDYLLREMPWLLALLDNYPPLDQSTFSCRAIPYGEDDGCGQGGSSEA